MSTEMQISSRQVPVVIAPNLFVEMKSKRKREKGDETEFVINSRKWRFMKLYDVLWRFMSSEEHDGNCHKMW